MRRRQKLTCPIEGIPPLLTLKTARLWALARLSKARAHHVIGVQSVGRVLASLAGLGRNDLFMVELACLLHDACKEFKDAELVLSARKYGMELTPLEAANGHLLHGPVAAFVAREELSLTNQTVLNCISEHTLGNCPMSDLSKLVFLADSLEASRPEAFTRPIWKALTDVSGLAHRTGGTADRKILVNLDKAMLVALESTLAHLTTEKQTIHPRSIAVKDYFLSLI